MTKRKYYEIEHDAGMFLVKNKLWMGHEKGPMAHVPFISIACKNQDFGGQFEILMGHLVKKKMGPRNIKIHHTAK